MKMSNAEICEMLLKNDHLSDEDKQVLLEILGYQRTVEQKQPLSDRISDVFTGFIGSWSFIILSSLGVAAWIILNSVILPEKLVFDNFPYVLLNLVLACIASLQAPIVMMSQNRQDKRESLKIQNDYEIDLKTIVIIEDLHKQVMSLSNSIDELKNQLNEKNKG